MLYITTRDDRDAYTAHRALHENIAPDGGLYFPFHMPSFTRKEIVALGNFSFGETIADILNRFFSCGLTGWDIDFCIGRNPVNLEEVPHRMVIAELWHNLDGNYDHICKNLYHKISKTASGVASEWFVIASHIAVLFGMYGEMCSKECIIPGNWIDIAVPAGDLTASVAAVYARKMGLPLNTIICTYAENSGLWDLINYGELSVSAYSADPSCFERLVHSMFGKSGVEDLHTAIQNKKTYRIDLEDQPAIGEGMFCAVTGKGRDLHVVNSIYRSHAFVLDPVAALSVGGLQDYRAKTGESKLTLVLSCVSPMNCIAKISDATGIAKEKLITLLKNPQDRRQ